MAQVNKGSFDTTSREGRQLTFSWSVYNTNIAENYTEIKWQLNGSSIGDGGYVICGPFKVSINGFIVYQSNSRIDVWKGTWIAGGNAKIYHNNDGTKTFNASVEVAIYEMAINCYGSGSWELPTIARFANITSFAVLQRDETSVTYSFSHDAPCDYAWYSIDNGSNWYPLPTSNIISGLSAGTTYQFKLRLRRTDSQATSDSSTYTQSTYNYPYCIDSPDFTIGNALTLKLYNPLNRDVIIKGYAKSNGAEIFSGSGVWSEITGFNDEHSVSLQYASIPNSQSGAYRVVVSWDNKAMERDAGNVYKIKGNEYPTINAFDYIDNNATVVGVTGDNTQIVQNKSILIARFLPATANYGAGSIVSYLLECNGKTSGGTEAGSYNFGVIDSARDVSLKLTAYDSRGLTASKTITVKMIAYEEPKASVELKRLNNYEDETYLTVDGWIANILDKNKMTIQYRYKQSGGQYGTYTTISDNTKQTLSLDKNNSFIFEVVVSDIFGGVFSGEYVLNKGVFPLFIDTVKNSVGINCFPKKEKSLEVNGKDLYDFVDKYEKSHKQILLGDAGGLTITVNSVYGTDKIPIIIKGADNASVTPVNTVILYRTDGLFGVINNGYEYTVTRSDNRLHINATQWSYLEVSVPMGSEITVVNSAL